MTAAVPAGEENIAKWKPNMQNQTKSGSGGWAVAGMGIPHLRIVWRQLNRLHRELRVKIIHI